jgi:hypothetical protein
LFQLVNLIAEDRLTRSREIEERYSKLPSGKLQAIAKRDGNTP